MKRGWRVWQCHKRHSKKKAGVPCKGGSTGKKVEEGGTGGGGVTPYKRLGKISDILHLNNENNQLERRAWPPKDVPLDAQS